MAPLSWPGRRCPPEAEWCHHTRSRGATPGRSSEAHSKPEKESSDRQTETDIAIVTLLSESTQ